MSKHRNLAQSYDILSVYNQFPQIGLQDNVIYDVLPVIPMAIGNTTVNATVFDAHCGGLNTELRLQSDSGELSSKYQWSFTANSTASHPEIQIFTEILGACTLPM